jgi:hypothetical protein
MLSQIVGLVRSVSVIRNAFDQIFRISIEFKKFSEDLNVFAEI